MSFVRIVDCVGWSTTVEDAVRRPKTKKDGGMGSSVLQNPSDPDAKFREKAEKQYRGYVANVDEAVGGNGSVVLDYQFEQNSYSDSQFLKDSLERDGIYEEGFVAVTDGAYFGEKNSRLAREQNVKLITTAISGTEVPEIFADFVLDEEGTRVLECPAEHAPKSCCYTKGGNGHIYVSFPKEQCRVKGHKKVCSLTISTTAQFRAKSKRMMEKEGFRFIACLRNGVETIPSILRRVYHTDRMPVRGCIRSGFFFGCKIAALNVRKLLTYKNGLGNYAQNPLLQVIR